MLVLLLVQLFPCQHRVTFVIMLAGNQSSMSLVLLGLFGLFSGASWFLTVLMFIQGYLRRKRHSSRWWCISMSFKLRVIVKVVIDWVWDWKTFFNPLAGDCLFTCSLGHHSHPCHTKLWLLCPANRTSFLHEEYSPFRHEEQRHSLRCALPGDVALFYCEFHHCGLYHCQELSLYYSGKKGSKHNCHYGPSLSSTRSVENTERKKSINIFCT